MPGVQANGVKSNWCTRGMFHFICRVLAPITPNAATGTTEFGPFKLLDQFSIFACHAQHKHTVSVDQRGKKEDVFRRF